MTNQQIKERAIEARKYFVNAKKIDGSPLCYAIMDKPNWVLNIIREVNYNPLPDNYKYKFVIDSLDLIIKNEGELDGKYPEPDVCHDNLIDWLECDKERLQYCDNAMQVCELPTMFSILQMGQLQEIMEVLEVVKSHLNRAGV
jgi:hypothetical protein